jgi:hypothetical protein
VEADGVDFVVEYETAMATAAKSHAVVAGFAPIMTVRTEVAVVVGAVVVGAVVVGVVVVGVVVVVVVVQGAAGAMT